MHHKTKMGYISLILIAVLVAGCATNKAPTKTSLELQAFQSKEFEADKKVVFASTLSVFQDLGYTVKNADIATGLITAKSPTVAGMQLFVGQTQSYTDATGFIETIGKTTKVRLNFVKTKITSSGYGMEGRKDTPVEDPKIYEVAFTKIEEAIFIRTASK